MLFYHFSLTKFDHLKIIHPYVETSMGVYNDKYLPPIREGRYLFDNSKSYSNLRSYYNSSDFHYDFNRIESNLYNNIRYKAGDISLLLSKPTKTGITKLRKNGFTSWGKVGEPYYIYTIDLEPYIDSILGYTITSIPEEWELREQLNKHSSNWTEEQKIWLLYLETKRRGDPIFPKYTIRERLNYVNCYNSFINGIRKHWLNFNYYVDEQVKRCNELGKYHNLYAAFIPHVIVKCKTDIMIKPIEIKKGE